ncbi:kinase-like domain-containing protein [Pseudomassariella vexata]|uniref:Kinase-like domain-containing protein n=1 Tax=Pseudomassariella vexata TaxID=1141098 RepID=A0A1Y2DP47_9PEZI|nr:kinase-like domain-containing protein [Pseudomassariella vexata]ORY61020.1 kinase-like domain-containing protein [Pseudomassariella vexata]
MATGVIDGLNSPEALPVTADQITASWCSKIFNRNIKNVSIVREMHGTASKIIVELVDDSPNNPLPKRLCFKGGFNPQLVAIHPAINATYRREAEFYYHIAPTVKMRLPKAWYCGSDTVTGQGIVAMEDLEGSGCTFPNALETLPPAQVYAGVEQLAALHAKTWGASPKAFPWVANGKSLEENPLLGMVLALLSPVAWSVRFAEGEAPPVPKEMADRLRIMAAFKTLWRSADTSFMVVAHGDAHIGNTFLTAEGKTGFIDWQGCHVNSAFHDVAYFVTGTLSAEDRREHEGSIVDHYLKTLAELGGPKLERADVWDEYRKNCFHGFAWALTAPQMQPKDIIFTMTARHCAAIMDHKTLELLEGLPEYKKEE